MIDIYVVSTYKPRYCGIAEFSGNLVKTFKTIRKANKDIGDIYVAAIDKGEKNLEYKTPEIFTLINQFDESSWIECAESISRRINEGKKLGKHGIVLANMEYGIIGNYDQRQDNYSPFIKKLKEYGIPLVTQLHTVLDKPSEYHLNVLKNIEKYSDAITVISKIAGDLLSKPPYSLDANIMQIDHGVRAYKFRKDDRKKVKEKYGLQDTILISTLGFNSPNKGREFAIKAHAEFLKSLSQSQRNRVVYIMAGGYHPDFIQAENGKYYREYEDKFKGIIEEEKLSFKEVKDLVKLERKNFEDIILWNKMLSDKQFRELLIASDVVINPTRDKRQISSGIVAEILGYGKASIVTESFYTREVMLPSAAEIEEIRLHNYGKNRNRFAKLEQIWDKSKGIVVSLNDAEGENMPVPDLEEIVRAERYLLFEPTKRRKDMELRARRQGRRMPWNLVGGEYHLLFQDIIEEKDLRSERLLGLRKSD
ncbi:MAG: hypothetical protein QXI33_00990 [Candidatus Pacearchaeota archaeon]